MRVNLLIAWLVHPFFLYRALMAPIGAALIGYREGYEIGIEWKIPAGVKKFPIAEILDKCKENKDAERKS